MDGVKVDMPLIKLLSSCYIVYPTAYGYTVTDGMQITINGVFGDGTNVTKFNSATFTYINSKWIKGAYVTVFDSAAESESLEFVVDENDTLSYASDYSVGYSALSGGIYIDGVLNSDIKLTKYASDKYTIRWDDYSITPREGMTVTIDGIFGTSTKAIKFEPTTFVYDGNLNWIIYLDIGTTGKPGTVLWLQSGAADVLAYNLDWSRKYWATSGGIYVNGVQANVPLIKIGPESYIVYFKDYGYTVTDGMQVTIDGVFEDDENKVGFKKIAFKYDGSIGTNGAFISEY